MSELGVDGKNKTTYNIINEIHIAVKRELDADNILRGNGNKKRISSLAVELLKDYLLRDDLEYPFFKNYPKNSNGNGLSYEEVFPQIIMPIKSFDTSRKTLYIPDGLSNKISGYAGFKGVNISQVINQLYFRKYLIFKNCKQAQIKESDSVFSIKLDNFFKEILDKEKNIYNFKFSFDKEYSFNVTPDFIEKKIENRKFHLSRIKIIRRI